MQALLSKRLSRALFSASISSSSGAQSSTHALSNLLSNFNNNSNNMCLSKRMFECSWSAMQHCGLKVHGSEIRVGNVIEKKARIYQVLKAQHTQQGRGGAMIQVELRDVDSGNKITSRFGTDEAIERVYVQEKSFTCLYTEGELVYLMEPETFEQLEVPKDLFGKASAYLKEEMKVTLQLYDERPLSASVPKRVTCIVKETQPPMKGLTASPQYKRALLDNGLTVQVPPFVATGDAVIIITDDDSYLNRAKE